MCSSDLLDGAAAEVTGETINGIQIEIVATGEDASTRGLYDNSIRLVIGGTASGTNKASGSQWTDTDLVTRTYGGATDLWGLTLDDTDITAADFGIAMVFEDDGPTEAALMSVYRVRVKIWYGEAVTTNTSSFFQFLD